MAPEDVLPPLSLYVHLPWCARKCPYCDFNSHEAGGGLPEREYVSALLRDLEGELEFVAGRAVQSVFIGGGTPSLFSGDAIAALLAGIRARVALAADCEITLEANPGSAEAERFRQYRAAGVNRLSMGIQSFRDSQLRRLGRIHGAAEARAAFAAARAAGFHNINLDLMYALPEDDLAGALADLAEAIALSPEHLSWYQLTLEPGTAFHRRPPPLPDDDTVAELEEQGRRLLGAAGYVQYEVSAYARDGRRCRHNLNYWRFGDYLGVGAGAHGKVTDPGAGSIRRRAKQRNPGAFQKQAGTEAATDEERIGSGGRLVTEFMMNALRLNDGVPLALFRARTGLAPEALTAARARAEAHGLLESDPMRLRATPAGLRFLNNLLSLFDDARDASRPQASR